MHVKCINNFRKYENIFLLVQGVGPYIIRAFLVIFSPFFLNIRNKTTIFLSQKHILQ
jgi:hypothetical protein